MSGAIPQCESVACGTQDAVSPFRSPSEEVCEMKRQRNAAHFWRGESERNKLKAQRALPCRRREFLMPKGLPEGLRNSLCRPAASLLRLTTQWTSGPDLGYRLSQTHLLEVKALILAYLAGSPVLPDGPGARRPLKEARSCQPPPARGLRSTDARTSTYRAT